MSMEDTPRFETLRAAAAALLTAWKAELTGIAREIAPGLLRAPQDFLEVSVEDNGLSVCRLREGKIERLGKVDSGAGASEQLGRLLARSGIPGHDVVLRIDPALVLRPKLRLPKASRRVLKGAVAHELERLTPTDPADLYFDFIVARQDKAANLADVTLRIVRRRILDQAIATCHGADALISAVAFAGGEREGDWTAFPLDRAAWLRSLWHRFGSAALAALAAILLLAAVLAGIVRGARADAALNDAVDEAGSRALVVERMEHRIDDANRALAALVIKRQRVLFVDELAQLSRLLPAGTWLTELHYEQGKFRADGYSNNASALIAIVDKSGVFADAQFSAPLVRNQNDGTDRFELTFSALPRRGHP